jgi:hypothetical protein
MKQLIMELLDRAARRAATVIGGGLVVSGDNAAITVGTLLVLAEYAFESWRMRRKRARGEIV